MSESKTDESDKPSMTPEQIQHELEKALGVPRMRRNLRFSSICNIVLMVMIVTIAAMSIRGSRRSIRALDMNMAEITRLRRELARANGTIRECDHQIELQLATTNRVMRACDAQLEASNGAMARALTAIEDARSMAGAAMLDAHQTVQNAHRAARFAGNAVADAANAATNAESAVNRAAQFSHDLATCRRERAECQATLSDRSLVPASGSRTLPPLVPPHN